MTQINANTTGQDLQVWLILRGLGIGLVFQPLNTLALSVVSNRGMAKASSLVNVTRQMTVATAVAALTTYLTAQTATHGVRPQAIAAGTADTFWLILILGLVCIPPALVMGRDPAIEALKKAQQAKADRGEPLSLRPTGQVQEGKDERPAEHPLAPSPLPVPTAPVKRIPHVISTLTDSGEQIMGPEILLWHYPKDNVVNGSLLIVESNQFCVLKSQGVIFKVYEAGHYTVQTPASSLYDSLQLTFSGEPIPWQHEVLYINRAKLMARASGIVLSSEMVEMDYHVDYSIHVATREDAIQLVQHMPYRGHTLSIQEVGAYAGPIIEEAVGQLLLTTPLWQTQGLQMRQDISQLVYQRLQPFLSSYGLTLDTVNVQGLSPRNEHIKALISLKAFGLSQLDAVRYYTDIIKHARLAPFGEKVGTSQFVSSRTFGQRLADYSVSSPGRMQPLHSMDHPVREKHQELEGSNCPGEGVGRSAKIKSCKHRNGEDNCRRRKRASVSNCKKKEPNTSSNCGR